eukprot:TRINITY_DN65946_c0_g1_i2.p1 TRINITY_DN65946_c0_g1~~TRINITY_DN65946_c0_g1_i2.p1  ORF type:complete len:505 (+),score=54.06 TRINITY_DN65946_c0_g1_i2:28-1542(+)
MYDVLVVGGGVSGLSAATHLAENGVKNILVLEANDRVGGRTLTDSEGTDLGGAYIGPTQDRLLRTIAKLDLSIYKVYTKGYTTQCVRRRLNKFLGVIPKLPLLASLDLNNLMVIAEKMAKTVPTDAPHKAPNAEKLDTISCKEWLNKHCWTQDAINLFGTAISTLLCVEPQDVSVLYFMWYIASGGGVRRMFETIDGAQDSKCVGGMGQVSNKLADRLGTDVVHLSEPVRSIFNQQDGVQVVTLEGKSYTAKQVIFAIPPLQRCRIHYSPPLDGSHAQLIQRFPMGSIIKTFCFYDEPYWRKANRNGMIVADDGICKVCFDDTKPDGSMPMLMGFIDGPMARKWVTKTKEERMQALAENYAFMFQDERLKNPVNYKEKIWMEEPYIGGCYVGVPPPGGLTEFQHDIRAPMWDNKVFFAGTETATQWAGYIDGAIQAGERAAREILASKGIIKKDDIWTKEPEHPSLPFVPLEISAAERLLVPTVPVFFAAVLLAVCAYGVKSIL